METVFVVIKDAILVGVFKSLTKAQYVYSDKCVSASKKGDVVVASTDDNNGQAMKAYRDSTGRIYFIQIQPARVE